MADALHAVMESDRTVYARQVVHRLQDEEQVILVNEHWQDDKALPLPSQMFRMGAEMVAEKTDLVESIGCCLRQPPRTAC